MTGLAIFRSQLSILPYEVSSLPPSRFNDSQLRLTSCHSLPLSMASQILQDILVSIQSGTDWVLRTFLAVLLRCLGILLKAVFRSEDRAVHMDEHGEPQKKKGEIIQERMSGVRQKKKA
jgi:hypothetical protein